MTSPTSSNQQQHLAAILPTAGSPLDITHRPTPSPGPTELLIAVESIALNPLDWKQQASGFHLSHFPAVLGSDVAGTVLSTGSAIPPTDGPFRPGTRVAAFAPCFFREGHPDYGALQARALVPAANAVPLPAHVSFDGGALLPMAVATAWSGLYSIGIDPRDQKTQQQQQQQQRQLSSPSSSSSSSSDKKKKREAILVWGGATSVGSATVQVARLLGYAVYATASPQHHDYLRALGAERVFDYRDADVVARVVDAVRGSSETLAVAYDAAGALEACQAILKQLNPDGGAKVASAPPLPRPTPQVEGVEVKFVLAPDGEQERADFMRFVFGDWLKARLESKEFVPSPRIKVVEGGLSSAQAALDELKAGVSGTKLVLHP